MKRPIPILIAVVTGAAVGFLARPETRSPDAAKPSVTGEKSTSAESRDPIDTILGALTQQGAFRQLAQIGELLNELDDEQMAQLMNRLSKLPRNERDILLPRLMAEWTRRNPQAATEWMRPVVVRFSRDPHFGNAFADGGTNLVKAWAENAPDIAIEIARQYADKSLGRIILHNAILTRRNHAESFEILRSFPPGENREKLMSSFFSVWIQYDRNAPLAAAAGLPRGTERDGALAEVLARLAKRDASLALAKYHELELGNRAVLPTIVYRACQKDPALAARTLDQFSAEEIAEAGHALVSGWARKDPAAAFAWAREHGIAIDERPDVRRTHQNSGSLWHHELEFTHSTPLQLAAQDQPDAAVAFVRSLPAGPERDRYIQQIVLAASDKPAVAAFISELPASPLIASVQLSKLMGQDRAKAEEYVRQLPPGPAREFAWNQFGQSLTEPLDIAAGPDRDAMLQGMARREWNNPEGAWIRLREISDPVLRQKAFDDLACSLAFPEQYVHRPPVSKLLELPGIPQEYKEPWLGL